MDAGSFASIQRMRKDKKSKENERQRNAEGLTSSGAYDVQK